MSTALQVAENGADLVLDTCLTKGVMCPLMSSPRKKAAKTLTALDLRITFRASEEDHAIISAGMEKHGLKKASDVLRMALRRLAEAEGFKKAS